MADTFQRRRRLLRGATGLAITGLPAILRAQQAPAIVTAAGARPLAEWGLQTGDVREDRAIVWSRSDRPARMLVEWSREESFRDTVAIRGPIAHLQADFTGRLDLPGLPADSDVFVRVTFEDLDRGRARSAPVTGRFRTAPAAGGRGAGSRDVRFVWGADTVGQGWGIDLASGGMRIYEAMRRVQPDFFVHCGDTIYADGPLVEHPRTPDGSAWSNAFLDAVPEKRKVAETQREFHRHYLYNLHDVHLRRFNAEVPQVWQWDDHEVVDNWSPGKDLSADGRYVEKRVETLIARAAKAFHDYAPIRAHGVAEPQRVYRHLPWGRNLDLFVIDMRSYRARNSDNVQTQAGPQTAFLGAGQIEWLMHALAASRATWKVIAADMPIGLRVADGPDRWEGVANGDDGPPLGRELEIAGLLRFIQQRRICNVVWITGDVHYCAAHRYDPARARWTGFDPFWEFVAGPLHAGTFGPNALDPTFGPEVVFSKTPPAGGPVNLPPSHGLQFFGQIHIDAASRDMIVALKDIDGREVFSRRLRPQACTTGSR